MAAIDNFGGNSVHGSASVRPSSHSTKKRLERVASEELLRPLLGAEVVVDSTSLSPFRDAVDLLGKDVTFKPFDQSRPLPEPPTEIDAPEPPPERNAFDLNSFNLGTEEGLDAAQKALQKERAYSNSEYVDSGLSKEDWQSHVDFTKLQHAYRFKASEKAGGDLVTPSDTYASVETVFDETMSNEEIAALKAAQVTDERALLTEKLLFANEADSLVPKRKSSGSASTGSDSSARISRLSSSSSLPELEAAKAVYDDLKLAQEEKAAESNLQAAEQPGDYEEPVPVSESYEDIQDDVQGNNAYSPTADYDIGNNDVDESDDDDFMTPEQYRAALSQVKADRVAGGVYPADQENAYEYAESSGSPTDLAYQTVEPETELDDVQPVMPDVLVNTTKGEEVTPVEAGVQIKDASVEAVKTDAEVLSLLRHTAEAFKLTDAQMERRNSDVSLKIRRWSSLERNELTMAEFNRLADKDLNADAAASAA